MKRKFTILLSTFVAISLISSCTKNDEPKKEEKKEETKKEDPKPAVNNQIKLTVISSSSYIYRDGGNDISINVVAQDKDKKDLKWTIKSGTTTLNHNITDPFSVSRDAFNGGKTITFESPKEYNLARVNIIASTGNTGTYNIKYKIEKGGKVDTDASKDIKPSIDIDNSLHFSKEFKN